MAKVKRKQIEYEGTNKQVIKGNGELGDYNDAYIVVLTSTESNINDISEEELLCDKTPQELIDAYSSGKNIEWRLKLYNNPFVYNLEKESFSETTQGGRLNRKIIKGTLYYNDFKTNSVLEVQLTITCIYNNESSNYTSFYVGTYHTNMLRTLNHEVLLPIDRGDANIHDGFYFPNAVQDGDGNWYGGVVIGDQVWLAENLKTTHYSNGDEIEFGESISDDSAYCYHVNGDANNDAEFGLLYNIQAVLRNEEQSSTNPSGVQGVSPSGWHIPSFLEWQQLVYYLSRQKRFNIAESSYSNYVAKAMASTTNWSESTIANVPGNEPLNNNGCGFNAKPGGMFHGNYSSFNVSSYIWLCSGKYDDCCFGRIIFNEPYIAYVSRENSQRTRRAAAMSVRCVSDLNPVQFRNWYIQQYGSLQHHLPEEVQIQSDWNQTNANAPDFIKNKPTIGAPLFYGYTNSTEATATKIVTLAEPTTGFKNGTYIMVYFAGGGVPAGNDNAISVDSDVYYLAYKAQGITQAGVINQGDKVLLWCHNGFAHVISNDRWSLPTVTAADEGKILKVVNGALTLVNP